MRLRFQSEWKMPNEGETVEESDADRYAGAVLILLELQRLLKRSRDNEVAMLNMRGRNNWWDVDCGGKRESGTSRANKLEITDGPVVQPSNINGINCSDGATHCN